MVLFDDNKEHHYVDHEMNVTLSPSYSVTNLFTVINESIVYKFTAYLTVSYSN